jgi:hypothetical protein
MNDSTFRFVLPRRLQDVRAWLILAKIPSSKELIQERQNIKEKVQKSLRKNLEKNAIL